MLQHRSVIGFSAYPVCQSGVIIRELLRATRTHSSFAVFQQSFCRPTFRDLSSVNQPLTNNKGNCLFELIETNPVLLPFDYVRNNVIKDHYLKEDGEIGFNRIMKYRRRYQPPRQISTGLSRFTGLLQCVPFPI